MKIDIFFMQKLKTSFQPERNFSTFLPQETDLEGSTLSIIAGSLDLTNDTLEPKVS